MKAFEVSELSAERIAKGKLYNEFLREESLSVGLYELPAGAADPQSPHTEDEVYYIVSGSGQIRVAAEDRPVQAGSVVYVAANIEHRFHSITADLSILVFFAPAEYTRKP